MKIMLLVFSLLILSFTASGQTATYVDPVMLGRGNTVMSDPSHYQSFFFNPAGFAKEDKISIPGVAGWVFTDMQTINMLMNPEEAVSDVTETIENPDIRAQIDAWLAEQTSEDLARMISSAGYTEDDIAAEGGSEPFFNSLTDEEKIDIIGLMVQQPGFPVQASDLGLPSGSARVGANVGIAFTLGGFGLGLFATLDAVLEGQNILVASGYLAAKVGLNIGFAYPFDLEFIKITPGIQVRPFINLVAPVDMSLIQSIMDGQNPLTLINNLSALYGYGIGLDAGVLAELWWFDFGFSLLNIFGTKIFSASKRLIDFMQGDQDITTFAYLHEFIIPMSLNFGLGFNPDFGDFNDIIDPRVYIDFLDLNGNIAKAMGGDANTVKDLVNIGIEIELLRFFTARGGYTNGYFTLGAGLDLIILEANVAAIFGALELEDVSDFGIAAEIAIRI